MRRTRFHSGLLRCWVRPPEAVAAGMLIYFLIVIVSHFYKKIKSEDKFKKEMPVPKSERAKGLRVKNPEGESASVLRLFARADASEDAAAVEPVDGIEQVELAVLSAAAQVHDATVAARVQPSFVQEDHERLLSGSRRFPVLLGETDAVLVRRAKQTLLFQDRKTFFFAEALAGVDDFDLVIPRRFGGCQREVGLRDPVVEGKAQRGRDLVGVVRPAHLHREDRGVEAENLLKLVSVDLCRVEFRSAAPKIGEKSGSNQCLKLTGLKGFKQFGKMLALGKGSGRCHMQLLLLVHRLDFLIGGL